MGKPASEELSEQLSLKAVEPAVPAWREGGGAREGERQQGLMFVSPGAVARESGFPDVWLEPCTAGRDTGEDRCGGECDASKLDLEWSEPASDCMWA